MVAKVKKKKDIQIDFCKILRFQYYYSKNQPKRFHLNGNTTGFRPQIQKLGWQNISP